MNRAGALPRHASPARRVGLRPRAKVMTVPTPQRAERAILLEQLADDLLAGTAPAPYVTSVAVDALTTYRLYGPPLAAAWDAYVEARRRLAAVLDGAPEWTGLLEPGAAQLAVSSALTVLLDGSPVTS
jgi:hypothetical protein